VRTLTARYDIQGRLTGELSGEGSALLTGGESQEEVDAIFAEFGTTHAYDAAGRRIASTDPNGNRTLYFYDADGRLTHTVNALGEVTERRYNALNQLTGTTQYGTRIDPAGLDGGLVGPELTDALDAIRNAALDSSTTISYNTTGTVQSTADALGNLTTHGYNAFREETARSEQIGPASTLDHTYAHDKRGLLVQTVWDPAGIASTTTTQYDAFGRAIQTTDPNGNLRQRAYDRAGRVLTSVDPLNNARTITYDALGRLLTQTDALGNTTTYTYDTAARRVTVTSPEGISVSTERNRHGQTQTLTDGRGNATTYSYDLNGNLIQTTDPLSVTTNVFDDGNRLIEAIDANGNSVVYSYDAANRVLSRQVDPSGLNLTTTFAYGAKGEMVQVTDANGVVTQYEFNLKGERTRQTIDPAGLNLETTYSYDGRGRVLAVVDPRGVETQYTYDKLGRRTQERVDPTGLNLVRAYAYDDNGNAVSATDRNGNLTRFVYDANDRLVYTVNAVGGVVQNDYDAEGRITRTAAYSTAISLAGLPAAPTAAQVQARIVASPADMVTRNVYDGDGRLVYTVDGTGSVVQSIYDANGNVVERIGYAHAIPTSTAATVAAVSAAVATIADPVHDVNSRLVYDAANRVNYVIDGVGAVTQNVYDANGNLIQRIAYAEAIPTSTPATDVAVSAALAPDAARDRNTCFTYDAANRLVYSLDAAGGVTRSYHDGQGRVVAQVAYANAISAPLPPSAAEIEALLVPDAAHDKVTRTLFDAAGRLVYSVDALGDVVQNTYDANGNVVQAKAFASPISLAGLALAAGIGDVQSRLVPDAANDRTTQRVLDADNRLVFRIDSLGFVEKNQYDAAGRVTQTIRYANALPAGTPATLAGVVAALTPDAAADQINSFGYDAAGHLLLSTDGLGFSESFTYDALGSKLTFTNKNGAVCHYQYDAAGRLVTKTEDPVSMSTVVQNPDGSFQVTTASVPLVTTMQYDALGQLTARTEAVGRPEQRATSYAYDAAGRQVRITFPPVNVYNAAGDNLAQNGATGAASRTDTLATLTVEVTYNAFGEAVVNRDVGGNYSYKVYDGRGAVRFEVDAEHNLTAYARDAFGNASQVTRYATALDFGSLDPAAALTAADVQAMLALQTPADHEGDRLILTTYDRLDRAVEVVEPQAFTYDPNAPVGSQYFEAGKTTRSTYNAFGQVVQLQTLRNPLTSSWTLTKTSFYDRRGNVSAEIDALGHLTTMSYDASGNTTRRVEFAQSVASWSTSGYSAPTTTLDDRETSYAFDRNNRRVSETRVNVEFSSAANGTSARGDLTTTYGYDAVGNLTRTTDALGNSVYAYYDALGRVTAVVAPLHSNEVDGTAVRPLSVFRLDAYGNVVQRIDYARGAASANQTAYVLAGTDAADRVSHTLYDVHGHAIQSADANGNSRFASYDAFGRVAKQWQPITGNNGAVQNAFKVFTYDKLGRQTAVLEPASVTNLIGELQPGYAPVTTAFTSWGISESSTQLSVNWSSFDGLGGGDVRVDLDYVDAVFTHDESGNVISVTPGSPTSTSQTFRAGAATSGVSMTPPGGITSVNRVRVYKMQANGVWAQISDRTAPGVYGNHLKLAAPTEAGVAAQFEYRPAGSSGAWSTLAAFQFQTGYLVDVSALASGNYDFQVTYTRQNETAAWAVRTGTITTVATEGGSLTDGSVVLGAGSRFSRETQYNAFGEIVARGINGGFQEYFDYDDAGHLWRTNTGDGVDKVAFYDLEGRATADVRSRSVDLHAPAIDSADDVNGLAGTMRTDTRYDAAGRAVQQVRPFFVDATTGTTVTPIINQMLDRWGNVVSTSDARSTLWITQYRYNAFDQLIEQINPDGNGQITVASPRTLKYYDALGRKVAERDANGNVNGLRYDGAGALIEELHADGGHVRFGFNGFGEQVKMVDAMGNATAYARDFVGNLLQATRTAVDVYTDDGGASFLGTQALSESYVYDEAGRRTSVTNGAGETTTYDYDVRGNVLRVTMPMGQITRMAYDFTDHKIAELNANSDIATWSNSYFGQTLAHRDIGGATYSYTYNELNQLNSQTNTRGQNQVYGYDQAGQLTQVNDLAINQQTTFGYNALGQHVLERTVQNGTVYQDNHLAYDTLGRLADVNDGRYHLAFAYDGMGNRVHETVSFVNNSGTARNLDYWYAYDSMNRQTVVDGVNNAGTITVTSAQGHQLTYDLNGNRTSDHFYQGEQITGYDESGSPIVGVAPGFVTRNYSYDAHNRLTLSTQGSLVLDRRHYDAAGRAVRTGPDAGQLGIAEQINGSAQIELSAFDANGRLIAQHVEKRNGEDKYELAFTYDDVGNELSHTLSTHTNNPYTNTYTTTYAKFDGAYKQTRMDGTSTLLQPGSLTQAYDANGHLVSITDATDGSANRTFVNDLAGKALRKVQGSATQHFLIVDGNQMGTSGADGAPESFTLSYSTADLTDTPAKTPDSYTVMAGDSLQSIAQTVWGDSSLWYLIADANGTDNASLRVGQRLTVPTRVNGAHNNYQVFKPYDPAKVIGDTTPNLPVPPSGGGSDDGCGGFGFIIVIIVTIVVAIYAPYLLGVVESVGTVTFASAVVGAVAGNIAGQVVGNAIGIQDGFDWKSVAVSAVTAGLTYGLTQAVPALQGTAPANVALRAAVSTAVNQGVRIVVGLQDKFDWRSVAASAVGAAAGAAVSNAIGEAQYGDQWASVSQQEPWKLGYDMGNTFVREFGSGLARNVVSTAIRGGKLDAANLVGDAFGNALGESWAGYLRADTLYAQAVRENIDREQAAVGETMRALAAAREAARIEVPDVTQMSAEELYPQVDPAPTLVAGLGNEGIPDSVVFPRTGALNFVDPATAPLPFEGDSLTRFQRNYNLGKDDWANLLLFRDVANLDPDFGAARDLRSGDPRLLALTGLRAADIEGKSDAELQDMIVRGLTQTAANLDRLLERAQRFAAMPEGRAMDQAARDPAAYFMVAGSLPMGRSLDSLGGTTFLGNLFAIVAPVVGGLGQAAALNVDKAILRDLSAAGLISRDATDALTDKATREQMFSLGFAALGPVLKVGGTALAKLSLAERAGAELLALGQFAASRLERATTWGLGETLTARLGLFANSIARGVPIAAQGAVAERIYMRLAELKYGETVIAAKVGNSTRGIDFLSVTFEAGVPRLILNEVKGGSTVAKDIKTFGGYGAAERTLPTNLAAADDAILRLARQEGWGQETVTALRLQLSNRTAEVRFLSRPGVITETIAQRALSGSGFQNYRIGF
jgi:YD repeat-containing protein